MKPTGGFDFGFDGFAHGLCIHEVVLLIVWIH